MTNFVFDLVGSSKDRSMNVENMKKIHDAFSISGSTEIYLRKKEVEDINTFLNSKQTVLHVCGNSGTGKTHVVTNTLKTPFLYLNYYSEENILKSVRESKMSVIVIDEFDKYYEEKRNESMQAVSHLKSSGAKLITLSNYLKMAVNAIFFAPYTSSDVEEILRQKLNRECRIHAVSSTAIKLISRKIGQTGDLRQLFRCVQDVFERKISRMDITEVLPEDVAQTREDKPENFENIHHNIINMLISRNKKASKMEIYSRYLKECSKINISHYDRTDFYTVYDIQS